MREMKREDAIREYGHRYAPSLGDFDFDVDFDHRRRRTEEEALIEKLGNLAKSKGDGVVKVVEQIGAPTESFHYKDLEAVQRRTETEDRKQYRDAVKEIGQLVLDASNSNAPQSENLKEAFKNARGKMAQIDDFLASRKPFKVEAEPLKDTLTLPDIVAAKGDTVYVVKDDGKDVPPQLVETTITKRDFFGSFFRGPDYTVHYETGLDAGKKDYETKGMISVDGADREPAPAGAVAKGLHTMAFNSKAAAEKHIGNLLDTREAELEAQLKAVRDKRKGLTL